MNRTAAAAIAAQYATRSVSGTDSVSWDDGVHCYIPHAVFHGKCEQLTYSGKNQFNVDAAYNQLVQMNVNYTTLPTGFTVERNGKQPPGYNSYLTIRLPLSEDDSIWGKTLTLSFNIVSSIAGAGPLIRFGYWNTSHGWSDFKNIYPNDGFNTLTVTLPATAPSNYMKYHDAWNRSGINVFLNPQVYNVAGSNVITVTNIQVEYGSSATSYEPYVGGVPSPSQSNPQPIRYNNGVFACGGGAVDLSAIGGLYAIPGTAYTDEWDSATGRGVRRCAVIPSYAGQAVTTPYISTTGALTTGATVVYGIPDAPFTATAQRLVQESGAGDLRKIAGDVAGCPAEVRYVRRNRP